MSFGKITKDFVTRVLYNMGWKMPHGMGSYDGQMCVQAAVRRAETNSRNYFNDQPECVDTEIRGFGIQLNDQNWGTMEGRAAGLRRFAVAELGTRNMTNAGFKFKRGWQEKSTFQLLPRLISALAAHAPLNQRKHLLDLRAALLEEVPVASRINDAMNRVARSSAATAGYIQYQLDNPGTWNGAFGIAAHISDRRCRNEAFKAIGDFAADVLVDMNTEGAQYMHLVDEFEAKELEAPKNYKQPDNQ